MCLSVDVFGCATPPAEVVRRIVDDAAADGLEGAFGVRVELVVPKPRCEGRHCEPTPYQNAKHWPDRARRPVHDQIPELGHLSGGACEQDGDCTEAGCGNHCVPWTNSGFAGTCPFYTALEPALCGCVDRQCTWFVQ
jgi:hypothetical protein